AGPAALGEGQSRHSIYPGDDPGRRDLAADQALAPARTRDPRPRRAAAIECAWPLPEHRPPVAIAIGSELEIPALPLEPGGEQADAGSEVDPAWTSWNSDAVKEASRERDDEPASRGRSH